MADAKLEIILAARDMIAGTFTAVQRRITQFGARATSAFSGIGRSLFNLKTLAIGALSGWGITKLGGGLIEVGDKFEKLKLSLDVLTKGRGEEWFKKLNEWALKMPVNTSKAIETFQMLTAMGIKPSLDQMTTLVDTMGAVGGGADTLQGIARALGQMSTKGKVVQQELNQLAERNIPIFDILREKFKLTGEQLGDIGNQGLNAQTVIAAIFEGLNERYGGFSAKLQKTWGGALETLKSFWVEFQRLIMESGVMKFLTDNLNKLNDYIEKLWREGKLKQWADEAGKVIIQMGAKAIYILADVIEGIGQVPLAFLAVKKGIHETMALMSAFGVACVDVAAFSAAVLNPWWGVQLFGKGMQGKSLAEGLREIFPLLAKARDDIEKFGQAQFDIAVETDNVAKGFESLVLKTEAMGNKIRDYALEWKNFRKEAEKPIEPKFEPKINVPPVMPFSNGIKEMKNIVKEFAKSFVDEVRGVDTATQFAMSQVADFAKSFVSDVRSGVSTTADIISGKYGATEQQLATGITTGGGGGGTVGGGGGLAGSLQTLAARIASLEYFASRGGSAGELQELKELYALQKELYKRQIANEIKTSVSTSTKQAVAINIIAGSNTPEELARQIKDELDRLSARGY